VEFIYLKYIYMSCPDADYAVNQARELNLTMCIAYCAIIIMISIWPETENTRYCSRKQARYIMNPHKEIKTDEDAKKFMDYWSNRVGFDNLYRVVMNEVERRKQKDDILL
jgi:hypothetical protein